MGPVRNLVFGWTVPQSALDDLRTEFPRVNIVFAPDDAFAAALEDADAAVAWSMTPAEYAGAKNLRWFQSIGAGVERVILPGMRESGLIVTNSSGLHGVNISEHVLALMLAFARQIPTFVLGSARARWRDDARSSIFELSGQTLHIVGYGDIGRTLGRKAAALGMRVTATRRRPATDDIAHEVTGFADLPKQLSSADHIAICLPQTPATVGLFDANMLAACKRGALIYNIGRGPIVDTDALIAALDSGHIAGAGLDVTEPEPLPTSSALWGRDNVIITAHTAGGTPHFFQRLLAIVAENLRRAQAGEPLINVVDLDAGY